MLVVEWQICLVDLHDGMLCEEAIALERVIGSGEAFFDSGNGGLPGLVGPKACEQPLQADGIGR